MEATASLWETMNQGRTGPEQVEYRGLETLEDSELNREFQALLVLRSQVTWAVEDDDCWNLSNEVVESDVLVLVDKAMVVKSEDENDAVRLLVGMNVVGDDWLLQRGRIEVVYVAEGTRRRGMWVAEADALGWKKKIVSVAVVEGLGRQRQETWEGVTKGTDDQKSECQSAKSSVAF